MTRAWLSGKRVLVVGMARSGRAVAEALCALGATAVLSDAKRDLPGIAALVEKGCENRLGEASEALVAGCDLVVVSPAVWLTAKVFGKAAHLGVPITGEMEFASRLTPGTLLAVTGTNGKTTTTTLLGEIFQNAGKRTHVVGNIGTPLSSEILDAREEDFLICEVSSFQLETVQTFAPRAAAMLNLTPDHLNRHGTLEAYGALKARVAARQTAEDFFIYNADDPFCASLASRVASRPVPFSRRTPLREGAWAEDGQIVVSGRALLPVSELGIPGPHNLENALAAAAMASAFAVPPPVIRHTLRTFRGVEHRMEFVREADGVRYINDSKGTNPDAAIRAVESMTVPTVLLAGGDDKGTPFDALARAVRANPNLRAAVLIGKTAEALRAALEAEGFADITLAGTDFPRAVALAREKASPGGAVLFSPACASFDMFTDYEARGMAFKRLVEAL